MIKFVFMILVVVILPDVVLGQKMITEVYPDLHHIHKWNSSRGDTWDPFWAYDDNLYSFNCDGRGFGTADESSNLSFNVLRGYEITNLTGGLLNRMEEYGGWSKHREGFTSAEGKDKATWKVLGQECIDGIFYAFVSRHTYGYKSGDSLQRQTAQNASLIKSTDKGITWTRSAEENYESPMWPGRRFGTPFFIHYGKNGGQETVDKADKYVYATSNNGFWINGDDYIIGRVERLKLPLLNVSDWSYFAGGDANDDSNWVSDIDQAEAILSLPKKCGSGPITYIPSLEVYLTVAWYSTERLPTHFHPTEITFDFYQAKHPWGPWKFISSFKDDFLAAGQHMYGPSLCAKFHKVSETEVKVPMFVSGSPFEDDPTGIYKMWKIPLILKTNSDASSSYMVNDNNENIRYEGEWFPILKQRDANYMEDLHYSIRKDDFLEFSFTGTGIEYLAQKDSHYGQVAIYLDGEFVEEVDLQVENFPRLSKVKVFTAYGLRPGEHKIKIVNIGNKLVTFDGFNVIK